MRRAVQTGLSCILGLGLSSSGWSSPSLPAAATTRVADLQAMHQQLMQQAAAQRAAARRWADLAGLPYRQPLPSGGTLELQRLGPLGPVFYVSSNLDAADTVSTDERWPGGSAGLLLEGAGLTVGEWDAGAVLVEHPDLYGRSQQMDSPAQLSGHSTHVAGTLVGNGGSTYPEARGMAPAANLRAYDWNFDLSEMALEAAGGLLVSNHSYGIAAGWQAVSADPDGYGWWWFGGPGDEDPNFGYYDDEARSLDQIAVDAPFYLMVKAAGNDRWDLGPDQGETYRIVDQNGSSQGISTASRPADCAQTGYDCLPGSTVAKNILTVGAVNDLPGGYSALQGPASVQMTGFSSFGPADDGRIKPDLVANGWLLLSTYIADSYFAVAAGTSMAAPSVSGSLLLLQEHYRNLHSGQPMRAATLKALAIHTADEAGAAAGPDYQFGWGLLNTRRAAEVISGDGGGVHFIVEGVLAPGASNTLDFSVVQPDAQVRVTLVWQDPPAIPVAPTLDPAAPMLVNDLDLVVSGAGADYLPWTLNPSFPDAAAVPGDNDRDNVERVDFNATTAGYTATVFHEGALLDDQPQHYSLIISVRPPLPVSTGLLVEEHFDGGSLPPGWTVQTTRGIPWTFHLDGSGRYANGTGGSGGYAMVDNNIEHATDTALILPGLDLSASESVVLRFNSFYPYLDELETLSVWTSTDAGGSWTEAWVHPRSFIPAPLSYALDLTGAVAGAAQARIRFRWYGALGPVTEGDAWQIDDVTLESFGGVVDPEPPPPMVLPGQAGDPAPGNAATGIGLGAQLSWSAGPLAESHNVYLGTGFPLASGDLRSHQAATAYDPGPLVGDTTYFWRVDEVNAGGTTEGVTWSFTTEAGPQPAPMHVGDIDAVVTAMPRNRWRAEVSVRVLDGDGQSVAGALVDGLWSDGASGTQTLATDTAGWVTFSQNNIKGATGSVTFTVADVSLAGFTFDPGSNSDPDGDSDGNSILVLKDAPPAPGNEPPTVAVLAPADGQSFSDGTGIALTATASDPEEGDLSAVIRWRVNGTEIGGGASLLHDFPDGTHAIVAAVTDTAGADASDTVTITVGDAPAATSVHVASLVDASIADTRRWTAVATITVHDPSGNPVNNATVAASWSSGARGSGTCITGVDGQCQMVKSNLKLDVGSVTLRIDEVTGTGLVFDPSGEALVTLNQP